MPFVNNVLFSFSSDNSSKKPRININRTLIFSSSDDDTSERKKNSSDDSESKVKTRRKKNTKSSDSGKTSSTDGRSVTKTRKNRYVDSVESKRSLSDSSRRKKNIDSELKIKTKKKNNIKRTPKVVSSPVKRIIRTAAKPLTRKKPSRFGLQSSPCSLQPSFLASLSSKYSLKC